MKNLILFFIVMSLLRCNPASKVSDYEEFAESDAKIIEIPDIELNQSHVFFDKAKGTWLLLSDSTLATGYLMNFDPNGKILMKTGLLKGKKEGMKTTYYSSGEIKFEENYEGGKLNGEVKRWSQENHQLMAHLSYQEGRLHGEQKKWYGTGEIHKILNVNMGQEEGMQKAFRKNGVVYANYEAKNGRTFGMKRSNLCVELKNEEVVLKR